MTESMSDAELAAQYAEICGATKGTIRAAARKGFLAGLEARRLLPAKADEDAAREIAIKLWAYLPPEPGDTTKQWIENATAAITAAIAAQRRASDERIARLRKVVKAADALVAEGRYPTIEELGAAGVQSFGTGNSLATHLRRLQEGDR